ncbi:MAG TPA: cysteine desulfurase family protein [Polyangiaceae bacterium]|nr:cysteine desulfurase family protein [Polyangiaceae bacterium]
MVSKHEAENSDGLTGAIYLDWNATTPPHPDVLKAMLAAATTAWGNPASVHGSGRRARVLVEELREELASALQVHPRDVVLTSGGTEANNLGLAHASGLVTSRLEHASIVRVAEAMEAAGKPVRWLPVATTGQIDPAAVALACEGLSEGSWIAIQAANHETGALQPIEAVSEVARRARMKLHVDAVQAFGKVDVRPWLPLADRIAIAAHKIRGPKGIGALAFRGKAPGPVLRGGSQERGLRPGTVDPIACAGFRRAVQLASDGPARYASLAQRRDELEAAFRGLARVNAADSPRLPHVSNLSFAGVSGDELVAALDLRGIQISSGSACAAGTAEPSPVIVAMHGRELARSAVRISFGDTTPPSALDRLKEAIFQLLDAEGASPGAQPSSAS